ncbi:programmed cell death protein 1 [Trichosurus vulpecula]|uniref:programmed cell death protein 1 n=1 Tax=Trichosurus vulpecula TaxID=9337 RepID=UPI00186B0516|nr:programmed cell death protein 1 [Trichosurus vulpecula]
MRPSWGNGAVCCFGLLLWASQLVPVKTKYSLGFWPLQLSRAAGENATFVCSVSHKLPFLILNWYREKNGSQPVKLAAYPKDTPSSHLQDRYHIAVLDDNQTYEMTILGLQLDDSGRYFCGIINLEMTFEMPPVEESDRSELNVTERIVVSTTTPPFTTPVHPEKFPWIIVVVSVIVGAVLVLLLLFCILFVVEFRDRGGAGNSESDKDSLSLKKAEPSVASVSTVVYGQLDFQKTEVPKQGGADSGEQTEYATIIFPAEKPAFYGSSPHRK